MKIPLEDNFNDIISKAQRGYQLTDAQLAQQAGVPPEAVTQAKEGHFDESVLRKLAVILKLKPDALIVSAKKEWYPSDPGEVAGLACFNTTYGDMTVNSYLVWDPATNNGTCFDTGADASGMIKFASDQGIRIQSILLTHTHPDHIADLDKLKQATDAAAFVCKIEQKPGMEPFEAGRNFRAGGLSISTRQTSGHSAGGITFVIEGLPKKIAIVGDALFAGSMGGGGVSYADALRNNCEKILTLPEDTILCPGHGPLTTVGEEKRHNPFFP